MLRGFYTAGTAMMAQSRKMDVITNNLVNADTDGYKAELMTTRSFEDVLIARLNDPSIYQYRDVGPYNWGIHVDETHVSFKEGSFYETMRDTDLAIQGEGFFVVDYIPVSVGRDEEADVDTEERYLRSGNLTVDSDGYLVTPNGHYVQDTDGRSIAIGQSDFHVGVNGDISVNGEYIATLRLVRFEDNTVLRKMGDNLFSIYEVADEDGEYFPVAEPEDITGTIRQGFLEASNVDVGADTVRMMETYRAYEINQKIVNIFDESLRLTVNDIAAI